MRIVKLILENFIPILAGTGKERICIDLSGTNSLINVLIGKIGSGKTYILSHLQPFATVGTMDVRNSEDPIIDGKDGYKEIIYDVDGITYRICHTYTWTGKGHAKKSYIQKDEVELNPNGNQSSFNDIILLEFGIDQSFMRLMRLGANVTNFINMKATERKSYIASLLKDTEFYLMLHKHWSADLRTINTKVSILMNKLNTFGNGDLESLDEQMEGLEDLRKEIQEKIDRKKQKKMEIKAEIANYLQGSSYQEFENRRKNLSEQYVNMEDELMEVLNLLERFKEYPELITVSKDIGKYDSLVSTSSEKLHCLEVQFSECEERLNNLLDQKAISGDSTHMNTLKETYEDLKKRAHEYERKIGRFQCKYSSTFLTSLLDELNLVNVMIHEITQYDTETVETIYRSDSTVIQYSKNKLEILNRTKMKLQREINNLKFSGGYEPPELLYRPPFCPTKQCPYYQSHPNTIKRKNPDEDKVNAKIISYQNELKGIDVDIYKYEEYPIIYSKISTLKTYWKKYVPILEEIGALKEDDLKTVLTRANHQVWYNYDRIIDTIDVIETRDKYLELTESMKDIRTELNKLDLTKIETLDNKIREMKQKSEAIILELADTEKELSKNKENLRSLNQLYVDLSQKSEYEAQVESYRTQLRKWKDELTQLSEQEEKIHDGGMTIEKLDREILEKEEYLKSVILDIDSLRTKINDISYTRTELDDLLQEQKWMSYMVDAVSSKKGIPMEMVKLFFGSCRESINSMLYMVTEDDFCLEEFGENDINESEFLIPYSVNGKVAGDISQASQGQTSIASTAISFAIVKELSSVGYTIPLLDEMDAPLHKQDKQKFISITLKYLKDINSQQCFIITHDENLFDGYPVQVIMTTDENVNQERYPDAIRI